jgi:tetratricopeptide (TPR) repeat protein
MMIRAATNGNFRSVQIIDWQNVFSTYEAKSISANFAFHLRDLRDSSPDVLNLLKVLVFFDPERIEIEMIKTGALALPSPIQSTNEPSNDVAFCSWGQLRMPTAIKIMPFGFLSRIRDLLKDRPDGKKEILTLPPSELDTLIKLMSSEAALQSALRRLQMLSFVKRRPVHEGGALYIHDLTQTLVQLSLISEGTQICWFRCAVRIACGAFRLVEMPTSPEFRHQCEGLISHILSLKKYSESVDGEYTELLLASTKIAAYWCSCGRYDEARETFQQILAIGSNQLDTAGFDAEQITIDLAEANWHTGNYNESILLYEEARRVRESQLGDDHPDTISVIESIAIVYRSQGRHEEAQSIFNRVLASRKISLGQDHPDTIRTMDNLARAVRSQGRYAEAESLYQQVLARRQAQLGADHPDTLWTADNLANNFRDQGRHSEALILLERVFQGRKSQLGDDHPQTLWTLANIAKIFSCQGRFLEAETLYGQALVGNEKMLGYNHQETLWVVDSLAKIYYQQARFEEAIVLYHRALLGREERLGHEHPNTMRTIHGLANLYRDRNDFIRSEPLYERLLRGRKVKLRPGHPEILQTYDDMADLFVRMGRNHEAEQYYRHALAGSIEELGSPHPDTKKRKESLGSFLKDRESQDRAALGERQEAATANEARWRATETIGEGQEESPLSDGL